MLFVLSLFGKIPEDKKEEPVVVTPPEGEKKDDEIKEDEKLNEEVVESEIEKEIDGGDKDLKAQMERAWSEIKKLRAEAKSRRLGQSKAEAELALLQKQREDDKKRAEREKMDEVDRLKAEKDDAEKSAQEANAIMKQLLINNAVISAAIKAGFSDPDDAVALTGSKFNETPIVNGIVDQEIIQAELELILEKKPYLKGSSRIAEVVKQQEQVKKSEDEMKKATNPPSETVVKVQKKDEDEIEELNKKIRENMSRGDGRDAARYWYIRYQKETGKR